MGKPPRDGTEEESNLGRKREIGGHADDDPEHEPDERTDRD